jgi:hypothetical protein
MPFKCSTCGKDDEQTKFYPYLKSKCIECRKKESKDFRKCQKIKVQELEENIKQEKREEKLNEIDPDENIRYLCGEMILNEKIECLRNKTLIDYVRSAEDEINELVDRFIQLKECIAKLEKNLFHKMENLESLVKMNDSRMEILIEDKMKVLKSQILNEIKNEIKE